jgi:Fanconi-associated nuclease 1
MLSPSGNLETVENFALGHYSHLGWKGHHSENSILLTLFGILFWNVLFDPAIPGVFNSPYQSAPLDLGTEFFYENRRPQIETLLQCIRADMAPEIIIETAQREKARGTVCIGVNWKRFKVSELIEIVQCIGGIKLAKICKLFAKTFYGHLGGAPDLCLWNPTTREFKMAEVKSENDKLSDKQTQWLQYLRSFEIGVELILVRYPVSKKLSELQSECTGLEM